MAIKDENRVKELLQVIDDLNNTYIEIGILGDEGSYDGGITVLGLAMVHEYGVDIKVTDKMRAYLHSIDMHLKKDTKVISIPARSFMRASYDKKKDKIFELEKELLRVMDLELPVSSFYDLVGQYCVSIIQDYIINDLKSPSLSSITIQNKKGKTGLLRDTGKLIDSIDYQVKRGKPNG